MQVTLHICEGTPRTPTVNKPEVLIGRAEDCDIRLKSPLVSRHHCLLSIRNNELYVRDLQSSNGTGLNNCVLLGEKRLKAGDTLWVGVTAIEVHIRQSLAAAARVGELFRTWRQPMPAVIGTDYAKGNTVAR